MQFLNITPALREQPILGESWIVVLVSLCLVILTSLKVAYPKRFQNLFKGFFTYKTLKEIMRNEGIFSKLPSVLTLVLFLITAALFLYEVNSYYNINLFSNLSGVGLYAMIVLMLFTIYFMRWVISEVLKFVFSHPAIETYFYTTLHYNKVLGVILLAVTFACAYTVKEVASVFLWIGYIVAMLIYTYRILRGFQIGITHSVSISYLFLYLCALEIGPAMVLAKLLITNL